MARNILDTVRGFQYQPFTADGAFLDPAAELGDGITANNVYSGIYTQKIKFGPLLTATVAAPEDEEINHEYPYKSKPNKAITREAKMLRASLKIEADRITQEIQDRTEAESQIWTQFTLQNGLIEAKVSKTGGNPSSFGWELLDSSWSVKSNGADVLKATEEGLEVYGIIRATAGYIGGFDILEDHLSYNNQTWGGTNTWGAYLGVQGWQMGKNFFVDMAGNLTAYSGTFLGYVKAGSILYGEDDDYDYGTLDGSGISSGSIYGNRLVANTVSTSYTSTGINASLGRADYSYNVLTGVSLADYIGCYKLAASTYITTPRLLISSYEVSRKSVSFTDGSGNTVTIKYWGY